MRVTPLLILALVALVAATPVLADTPANCTYPDLLGTWTFSVSHVLPTPSKPSLNCDFSWQVEDNFAVRLGEPNIAVVNGAKGNWTMIYNQGLEIWANGVIHFAFSAYDSAGQSICGKSQVGWSHSADGTQWRCLQIIKTSEDASSAPASKPQLEVPSSDVAAQQLHARRESERLSRKFSTDHSFLAKVNKAAKGQFTVREYPEFNGLTIGALERRRGTVRREGVPANPFEMLAPEAGVEPAVHHRPERHHQHVALQSADASKSVPASFDWRNVNGVNYVSPVRDQGQCGSCYAFSAAGMMEARIRVRSNNTQQPILSTQDVVSCSLYSQGCEGGFPYLIGGKYGRDYGFTEESCYPYAGVDSLCTPPNPSPSCNPRRWKTAQYYYIGGFYGQSTPAHMQEEIMANGPISVSFMVYDDFMHYSGGVYSHHFAEQLGLDDYNPFELTNHAVLMVGWGTTSAAEGSIPYWIVKNSWGPKWGEQGYFRILRSLETNPTGGQCAIESLTVSAIPIVH